MSKRIIQTPAPGARRYDERGPRVFIFAHGIWFMVKRPGCIPSVMHADDWWELLTDKPQ